MAATKNAKTYKVKEVASIAHTTVRALHHYDALGLLVPSQRSSTGYRLYSDDDLLRLHHIMLWRELGLPLEQIRSILDDPQFDRRSVLLEQREQLVQNAQKANAMVTAIDAALHALEKDEPMNLPPLFDGFDPSAHEDEVRKRWGTTDAYAESAKRTKNYEKSDWSRMQAELSVIMKKLVVVMTAGEEARSTAAIDLAEEHRLHIDQWFYPCSRSMHAELASMYVADPRFAAHFETYGEGLAEFLSKAIAENLKRREQPEQ